MKFDSPWRRHRPWIYVAAFSVILGVLPALNDACANLELVNTDVAWPESAPVRTQSIPAFNAASRGVRGDRFQYQTFEVTESFSLGSLLIGYGYVGGTAGGPLETNFVKVAIYEVTRTYNPPTLEDAFVLGDVVAPQVSFLIDGTGKSTSQFYAMELAWNAEDDGELILEPRTGNLGYAIQVNGTHVGPTSSAINLIERNGNPNNVYSGGRAYEYQGLAQTGPYGNGLYEFPIVLTARPDANIDGDFNLDGTVDAADYVMWRKTNEGDPTAYADWVANFAASNAGSGGAIEGNGGGTAVPEPSIWLLLSTAAGIVIVSRRRIRVARN